MKKYSILMSLVLLALVSCQEELNINNDILSTPVTKNRDSDSSFGTDTTSLNETDTCKISKWDALEIVEPITSKYPDRWVYISNEIIPAGSLISYNMLGHTREVDKQSFYTSPDFDAWLLMIEEDLSIMGQQNVLHLFVDVNSGEVFSKELAGRAIVDWDTSRNVILDSADDPLLTTRDFSTPPDRSSSHGKYAVIISGGTDMYNNTSCFYNDTRRIYNILIDSLHYFRSAIFVYMSDGTDPTADQRTSSNTYISSPTDLDNDGTADVIAAQRSRLSNGFSILALWAQPGDEVLVFMTDTGYYDGSFNLWDGEALYPNELKKWLNRLNPLVKVDIVMGQSYSGAFISTIAATNRTITTSCSANETAHRNTYSYSYFLDKWTNAISVYADVSTTDYFNDAYATPYELYGSANSWITAHYSEQPQYSSTPSDFGEKHSLCGDVIPYLTGSSILSQNSYSSFTVTNCPVPCLMSWDVGTDVSLVSYSDSTAIVKGNISSFSRFYSSNTRVTAKIIVDGYMHHITKVIDAVWKPGQYMNYNLIQGQSGLYWVGNTNSGAYGYYWESSDPAWQITSQYNNYVYVSEGYTSDPVYLMVTFYDPFGGSIFVFDQVN